MIIEEDIYLEHFGVKGMRWGVRKERDSSGLRGQATKLSIDPSIHSSTQTAAKEVAVLIGDRYGFRITSVKDLKVHDKAEYDLGVTALVHLSPGKREGVILARPEDWRPDFEDAVKTGWMAAGTTNPKGMLTHESAHAMFHADQKAKGGFFTPKTMVGSHQKERDNALIAMAKVYDKTQPPGQLLNKVSGYAAASRTREELEAEMFSQYHWGTNTPKFIQVWGETLHKEMGLDPTPFKEVMKNG